MDCIQKSDTEDPNSLLSWAGKGVAVPMARVLGWQPPSRICLGHVLKFG